GLGMRGYASLKRLTRMKGVEVKALCDRYEYPVRRAQDYLKEIGAPPAVEYFTSDEVWKDLCARDDLDVIYVTTPPWCHAEMAIQAMLAGKHVATEVPAAQTMTDCWRLVDASEKMGKHCFILENCCYDFFEAMTMQMAQQGFFGEIVHGEGAYYHYQTDELRAQPEPPFDQQANPYYRVRMRAAKGNIYPTHGFGPIAKAMNLNTGDRVEYMSSVETNDFIFGGMIKEMAEKTNSPYFKQFVGKQFVGINSTIMRTANGKTVFVDYNTTYARPYSRIHQLTGVKGFAMKYPTECICQGSITPFSPKKLEEVRKKYTPELHRYIGEMAKQFGGHDGMDFIEDWRFVNCLQNGLGLDLDVYDAVMWSSVTPLSLWSITHRSNSIDVPDFTGGNWKTNAPIDLSLRNGGRNTEVSPEAVKS
ncbi:MAG: Gfo/Idh/MocA family oxidoreductase, partial [Planctomycetia bacterium]|nr:Gfo/Idh/MocA family oxidoreductase [Planctomycetia bacterium]